MIEGDKPSESENEEPRSEVFSPDSAFPSEPFACPACGQLLGPACRICVACGQPIDPAQIRIPQAARTPLEPARTLPAFPAERVRFSWQIFFTVLVAWFAAAVVAQRFLGSENSKLALGSVVIVSSVWVFFDARLNGVPRPLRWGLGSLLLWIVFFPWYLARRRTPQAPCPTVEAEPAPLIRVLLVALLLVFLLGIILAIIKGPPPK